MPFSNKPGDDISAGYMAERELSGNVDTAGWAQDFLGGGETAVPTDPLADGQPAPDAPPRIPDFGMTDGAGVPDAAAAPASEDGGVLDALGTAVGEVGLLAKDIPTQTIGAFRDVLQEVADIVYPASSWLDENIPLGAIKSGQDGISYLPPWEMPDKVDPIEFFEVPEGDSALAPLYRGIMRFAIGFKGVGNTMKLAGVPTAATKAGQFTTALAKGAATDMLVWDEHEARLSDLVQEIPALENPVTEYLATDMSDSMFEGKMKQALEGGGVTLTAKAVMLAFKGVKAIKVGREARSVEDGLADAAEVEARMQQQAAETAANDMKILGDPAQPMTMKMDVETPEAMLRTQMEEGLAGRVAGREEAAARGLKAVAEGGMRKAEDFPVASKEIEGLEILDDIPNQGSISASFTDYEIISGIREVDLANFTPSSKGVLNSPDIVELAGQIKANKKIKPLIVAEDAEGFYILEGAHRFDAMQRLGKKKIPAMIVRDLDKPAPKPTVQKTMPNFSRINAPEEVDVVLKEMAAANADLTAAAKGGIVSHETTYAAAKELGIEDVAGLQKFNAAELDALKDFYGASGNLVYKAADAAAASPTEANLFAYRKAVAIHQALLEKFTSAKAEAGRTLNILGRISDAGDVERLAMLKDLVDEMGGRETTMAMIERTRQIKAAGGSAADLNNFTQKSVGARTFDAVQEAWVLGLLSGPRTQARNLLSNAVFTGQLLIERGIAARMPGSEIAVGEASAAAVGVMSSLRGAFVNAGKAFATGVSGYGTGKVDLPYRKAISRENLPALGVFADYLGGFYRVAARGLSAGDEFFKTINYSGELHALAYRDAMKKGLSGDDLAEFMVTATRDPSEPMRMAARTAAAQATFTNQLGDVGQAYKSMVAKAPIMRFLTPFINTPGNLFKQGFARSPFALAMPKTFWNEIKAGGPRKDLAMSKVLSGSAVMALWTDMASRGQLSGNGPVDPNERSRLRETGWMPYAMQMPDHPMVPESYRGKWVNYRAIEPIGMILGMAADVTELMQQYSEARDSDDPEVQANLDRLAWSAVSALGNSVTSQTFMRSVSDFFKMQNNPYYAETWVSRYASSFVPKAIPAVDDIRRSFWGTDDEAEIARGALPASKELKATQGILEAMQNEIPWMRDSLHPLRNLTGHPIQLSGAWGPDWISPIYTSRDDGTPLAKEIIDQKIGVNKPSRSQGFTDPMTGQTVRMNMRDYPDVWDEFMRLQGHGLEHPVWEKGAEDFLSEVVSGKHDLSEVYMVRPDGDEDGVEDKGAFIKAIFADYRKLSREAIMADERFADFQTDVRHRAQRKMQMQLEGFGQ